MRHRERAVTSDSEDVFDTNHDLAQDASCAMYCTDSVFIISMLSDVTCLPDNVQIKKMDSLFALLLGNKAASTHFERSSANHLNQV